MDAVVVRGVQRGHFVQRPGERERERERESGAERERERERGGERERGRESQREIERQTETETETERDRERRTPTPNTHTLKRTRTHTRARTHTHTHTHTQKRERARTSDPIGAPCSKYLGSDRSRRISCRTCSKVDRSVPQNHFVNLRIDLQAHSTILGVRPQPPHLLQDLRRAL